MRKKIIGDKFLLTLLSLFIYLFLGRSITLRHEQPAYKGDKQAKKKLLRYWKNMNDEIHMFGTVCVSFHRLKF